MLLKLLKWSRIAPHKILSLSIWIVVVPKCNRSQRIKLRSKTPTWGLRGQPAPASIVAMEAEESGLQATILIHTINSKIRITKWKYRHMVLVNPNIYQHLNNKCLINNIEEGLKWTTQAWWVAPPTSWIWPPRWRNLRPTNRSRSLKEWYWAINIQIHILQMVLTSIKVLALSKTHRISKLQPLIIYRPYHLVLWQSKERGSKIDKSVESILILQTQSR